MSTSERVERERDFHDKRFGAGGGRRGQGFYAIDAPSREFYQRFLESRANGREVLEYGCGPGSLAFFLARRGASVTGIDISSVAIEQSREVAEREGVSDRVRFEVMDAEDLNLAASSFDLVCGTGILHHLDLERAFTQLGRVLKPDGEAIFVEPLGHNPAINLFRRMTPESRTEDEHPLLTEDLDRISEAFGRSEFHFFHLTTVLAMVARNRPRFEPLLRGLARVDDGIFRAAPPLRKHAWMVVMVLGQPRAVAS
jgi:SAM-dependent methyltransferase